MYLIFRFLFCLCSIFFLNSCSKKTLKTPEEKPLFVKFEAVNKRPVLQSFETAGELKAAEEILVAAERPGQVERIYVREGSFVKAGTVLVKIKGNDVLADLKKAELDYLSYKKLYNEGAISQIEFSKYEANLNRTKSQMDNLVISAVTDATVGQIYIDHGDYLKAGDKIMDMVKLNPLRVSYTIPEKLISKLSLGQDLQFTVDSYPGEIFNAKIDFVSPRVDPLSRTVLVRALVQDSNKKLKANQFVTVKQEIARIDDALMVREESVYLDQGAEYLYLADSIESDAPSPEGSKHQARLVKIKTGIREPGWVQVLEGINEGDNVIYAGLTTIYPGAKLIRVEETQSK